MKTQTIKTYTRRDSATGYLRACGINKADYNLYITKIGEDFIINLDSDGNPVGPEKAEKAENPYASVPTTLAAELASAAKTAIKKTGTPHKEFAVEQAKTKKVAAQTEAMDKTDGDYIGKTVTATARAMIIAGKSNAEVTQVLLTVHNCAKPGYAAWYRADCKRKGLI